MARVVAISSQVARGAIGLSAAVPALQALGHEVIALPTILLSNHPGHARFAGERIAPDLLRRMLDALDANGWLGEVDALLTGYLPSAEHVAFAAAAVALLRQRNPRVRFVCDPVLGDDPKGVYIDLAAAEALRDGLVPKADALKMNCFEAAWLSGVDVRSADDVAVVARSQGWREVVVTSVPSPDARVIASVHCEATMPVRSLTVPRRARVPNGTGDLMAALFLGHGLRAGATSASAFGSAVAGVDAVIAASEGHDELQLVKVLHELVR